MNMQSEAHAPKNGEPGSNFSDVFQSKHGYHGDFLASKISELMKLESLESATSRSLFSAVTRILEESIEKKNESIPQRVASVVKLVVQEIEHRVYKQAENMRKQRNLYKSREDRYQLKIRALETLATGTIEENEIVMKLLQQIKIEKALIEKKMKLEENDLNRLRKERDHYESQIFSLKQELELAKTTYEENQLQLETHAKETKFQLEKRITELECLLADSRNKVKELEDFSESKFLRWKRKEHRYVHFINTQFGSLQELRLASESLKEEVLKTKEIYADEVHHFGLNLKELVEAAQNYHTVLEENRKLYNEVQDLKGNIRVYCRIRPFLPGQSEKHTTIQYIGDNGELVVINPSKQGKDSHRLFKFNKVFGPAATQEEVFRDTQPLIRSVLDGYNVCIFAYGQTGSGKTYTMSGPSVTSVEDWGVNYRALNDLFNISQSRKSSIAYEVGVQMVEIYNEQVRDLLNNDSSQKRLGIWNTSLPNGLAVPDASMHPVRSTTDVLDLMSIGLMNRAVGATALNERSSRSHSVLTVHVRGTDLETHAVLRGCLHLVDLAGSERVERSEATGDRLREAQHINKSLSALGDVISALAQKSSHVPYRNSKLTQVLQSSLGSQAKALMFIQLNPDVESFSETISTLKFAERASGVELGAARSNKEGRGVRELMEQMAFLKDVVMKKDEEIGRLRSFKTNGNTESRDVNSSSYRPASPRRLSIEASHPRRTDLDNSSEYSDKHCEAVSQQSIDSLRHYKEFFQQSRLEIVGSSQNSMEDVRSGLDLAYGGKTSNLDVGLLNFGDTDSEERLSDMSDGVFTTGTETDSSISNRVEHVLFSETAKRTSEIMEKRNVPVKLPRPHQKQVQAGSYRLSMGERSSKVSSSKRATFSSSSAMKLPKQRVSQNAAFNELE